MKENKLGKYVKVEEFWDSEMKKLPEYPDYLGEELLEKLFMTTIMLIDTFDYIRETYRRPIQITSGYRTIAHHEKLKAQGLKTAKFVSPHTLGVAMDIKDPYLEKEGKDHSILYNHINSLPIGKDLRIGFKAYSGKFIHIDIAYELPIDKLYEKKYVIDSREKYFECLRNWKRGVRW
jgi:uncharacterized protein YcbK (DUF882 family)